MLVPGRDSPGTGSTAVQPCHRDRTARVTRADSAVSSGSAAGPDDEPGVVPPRKKRRWTRLCVEVVVENPAAFDEEAAEGLVGNAAGQGGLGQDGSLSAKVLQSDAERASPRGNLMGVSPSRLPCTPAAIGARADANQGHHGVFPRRSRGPEAAFRSRGLRLFRPPALPCAVPGRGLVPPASAGRGADVQPTALWGRRVAAAASHGTRMPSLRCPSQVRCNCRPSP